MDAKVDDNLLEALCAASRYFYPTEMVPNILTPEAEHLTMLGAGCT
jgi:hypothetical protein